MKRIICFSFVLSCVLFSCEEDAKCSQSDLNGNWDLFLAERNGKETGTLKGTFFNFQSDTSLVTNVFGSEESYKYQLKRNRILTKGDKAIEFKIETIQKDTLVLSAEIQNNDFKFSLLAKQ